MIPSCTTGIIKRFIALATACMLSSCAAFLRDGKPVEFTAATYNVHYMERGIPGLVRTIKGLDADVVAMQEVLSTGGQPASAQIAGSLGYHHVASMPYVNYGSAQWVLAILSRHPIVARDEIRLGNSRRALRAVVNINGRPVEFITMHLMPLAGHIGGMQSVRQRAQSRRTEITDLLTWLGEAKGPRILLGDFNMLRGTMGFYDLDEYDLVSDAYSDADGGWLPTNSDTFPLPDDTRKKIGERVPIWLVPRSITLDYIFVSDGVSVLDTDVIKSDASDHWPLVGRFRL
ncbi:MAG: hypothetical protein F9K24_14015 [Leptonema illini]|uniref:Endonuclease/exonuclease/phosphatase domain-containing protein n=1 Tax=Leptonema illini TaxID=183 RepID=A0A833GZX8_9LEPT|nr:MAG: hypothetical protein F9K24_14015 [Leptonema illini]